MTANLVVGQKRHCALEINGQLHINNVKDYDLLNQSFESKLASILQKRKSSKANTSEVVYNIPVVVHIVHNDATQTPGKPNSQNISDEQIYSQIAVLQEDFRKLNSDTVNTSAEFKSLAADSKINFCLASRDPFGNNTTGITRHFINVDSWNIENKAEYDKLRTYGYWPPIQYLNIWVANLEGAYLGIATFPGGSNQPGLPSTSPDEGDGIVIDYEVFGNQIGTVRSPFDRGRTTVHEVGHWLGLLHTFQGGCSGFGDYCNDTPRLSENSLGCPVNQSSCSSKDMTENFMDYTNDQCLSMFSTDQKNRMRAVIESDPRRNALISSPGCCGGENSVQLPIKTDFEENDANQINWNIESSSTNLKWKLQSPGYLSSYSLSANTNNSLNDTTTLTSNIINFNGSNLPALAFDLAYNHENQTSPNDRFILSYEKACDERWITIKEFSQSEIATTFGRGLNYVPTDFDWKGHYFQLPQLQDQFAIKLRFQIISANSGSYYLDNIYVFNETFEPLFEIFPNPTHADINIQFTHQLKRDATIILYNVLGTIIDTYEIPTSFSDTFKISTSDLSSGMYILVLQSGEHSQTEKLVISK